ncbi:MAG TPA: enoyl-CoA hydratase-related protein [Candidatus Limnocylindrales bacterium]|nr:enoyl-CoA hydratase-related protein [Candidatus Limnocylindrales bacterium]
MYETVKTETRGKTGWITINREERRNSLNPMAVRELTEALKTMDHDQDIISLVLTGAGEKAFCAGMDLGGGEALQLSFLDRHELQRQFLELLKSIKALHKPLIARVQGMALGGGFGLMSACDLVVASDDVQCGTPEINLGLFPYMITAVLLRATANPKALLEMMLTGERISAERAAQLGFINYLVKREDLDARVEKIAGVLNTKSSAVLRLGRRAFYTARDMPYEQALEYLSGMLALNMQAEDMMEGIMAFMEKREPTWQGK